MGIGRNWTAEEKRYLKDHWGTKSIDVLCRNLNRSKNGILIMVQRLGLGPFLESGEYISWNQFMLALGTHGDSYKQKSWIENQRFPVKFKKVNNCKFKVVYLDEFWKWADKNRDFIDWSMMEENILGAEPSWVKELRRHKYQVRLKYKNTPWSKSDDEDLRWMLRQYKYTIDEISKKIGRTCGAVQRRCNDLKLMERPIKAENHNKWTEDELALLKQMTKERIPYEIMADRLNRSSKAIRGTIYRLCQTENLDKAAGRI